MGDYHHKILPHDLRPFAHEIRHLEKVSGLHPNPATHTSPAESIPDFMNRAMEKIQEIKRKI